MSLLEGRITVSEFTISSLTPKRSKSQMDVHRNLEFVASVYNPKWKLIAGNLVALVLLCGVVVQHADSQHRGCQFDSSLCRFKNAIGEEGNGNPPHEFNFPRKNSEPCLKFLLCSKSSCNAVFFIVVLRSMGGTCITNN